MRLLRLAPFVAGPLMSISPCWHGGWTIPVIAGEQDARATMSPGAFTCVSVGQRAGVLLVDEKAWRPLNPERRGWAIGAKTPMMSTIRLGASEVPGSDRINNLHRRAHVCKLGVSRTNGSSYNLTRC